MDHELLNTYKWKCGYQRTPENTPCQSRFISKPELILHLSISHGIRGIKDVTLPKSSLARAVRSIEIMHKQVG